MNIKFLWLKCAVGVFVSVIYAGCIHNPAHTREFDAPKNIFMEVFSGSATGSSYKDWERQWLTLKQYYEPELRKQIDDVYKTYGPLFNNPSEDDWSAIRHVDSALHRGTKPFTKHESFQIETSNDGMRVCADVVMNYYGNKPPWNREICMDFVQIDGVLYIDQISIVMVNEGGRWVSFTLRGYLRKLISVAKTLNEQR